MALSTSGNLRWRNLHVFNDLWQRGYLRDVSPDANDWLWGLLVIVIAAIGIAFAVYVRIPSS